MSKLVPYWGLSAQPGSTYYLQKLSHDIFRIVDHGQKASLFIFLMNAVVLKTLITQYLTSLTI